MYFFFSEAVPFPFFELVPSCSIFRRKKKKHLSVRGNLRRSPLKQTNKKNN